MTNTVSRLGLPVLALLLAATSGARAQGSVPATTKVAIINIQGAILATDDGEKARAEIQKLFADRFKEMEGRTAEINKLKDQFNKGANTMSAEAKDKLSRDIDDKSKRFQWDSEDLQNDVQEEEQKRVNEIGQRMVQIIDGYAKEHNLTLVLDVSGQQNPVLWAANGIDISREVVELYNKKHAGPAAPAAKPAAAPPAAAPKKPACVK